MSMITKSYIHFFEELGENNHKEWFHSNKKRYESDVKKPFQSLIEQGIDILQSIDPDIPSDSKDILMRINRDIRFSKDKSPYNTMMKSNFTPGGRKSGNPGFYLGIGAEKIHLGGGMYQIQPATLRRIRSRMAEDPKAISNIIESPKFRRHFGVIAGEKAKRIDKEFDELATKLPLIYHKQYYYMSQIDVGQHLEQDLTVLMKDHFEAARDMHLFLKSAIS